MKRSLTAFLALVLCLLATQAVAARRRAVRTQSCATGIVAAVAGAGDLVVDAQYVYYGDESGSIHRVPRNGGSPVRVTMVPDAWILYLAIDSSNIYFVARSRTTTLDSVYRSAKDGGQASPLITDLRWAFEIIPDGEWLYVLVPGTLSARGWQADGEIRRVKTDGSATETLASHLKAPVAMEIDGDLIYFVETGSSPSDPAGGIRRMAKSGGPITTLATMPGAWAMTQDASTLYVLRMAGGEHGPIEAVSKLDGRVTPLVSDVAFEVIEPMEVFEDSLFFLNLASASTARLEVVPVGGGEREVLREFPLSFPQFAIDACGVYFATPSTIERVTH